MDETNPDATPACHETPPPDIAADGDRPANGTVKSFADTLYEKITGVIGGDNPNQFFCMGLPGTMVEKNQYTYDVEHNEPKPPLVEANESKLVNKLFDACPMTSSDNGRQLQTQFKTALDMLTPRLNGVLFRAKTQLREVLMTPYAYNFGDGTPTTGLTLQQVFYRLYGEYVAAKQKWAAMQVDKKAELTQKHGGGTAESNRAIQNEYLDWYETTAEAQILGVEEKLGKVLNVFSPGDMEIITGILDSGTGREIAEARQALDNVRKLNPDGGYVFPVTLYPENWFTLLDNSFAPTDLLDTPAALSQKLAVLTAQRSNLTTSINTFLSIIPDEAAVANLKTAADNADKAYKAAFDALVKTYASVTIDMLKTFIGMLTATPGKDPKQVAPAAVMKIFNIKAEAVSALLAALGDNAGKCLDAQSRLIDAAQAATSTAMAYFEQKNLLQYKAMLLPLQDQLARVEADIARLQLTIAVSTNMRPDDKDKKGDSVVPNHVPDNFTQVIITSEMSDVKHSSSSSASSSKSSCGVTFFFGGYSRSESHSKAVNEAMDESKKYSIEIGMSIAKVKIGREWFNPGVFLLSSDMYNTSSSLVSPGQEYDKFDDKRFAAMNKCVFPCFPTAFVIARDVTIRFSSSTSFSTSFAESVEDHSSRGGGFFIFGGSSSSSSSSSRSNSHATSTADGVTIRFTSPQILGYYLEATPPDKSKPISSEHTNANADFISIFEFVRVFQEMLDDYNKKHIHN